MADDIKASTKITGITPLGRELLAELDKGGYVDRTFTLSDGSWWEIKDGDILGPYGQLPLWND